MTDTAIEHANAAYDAIRSLTHDTRRAIPAPEAYDILGNLQAVGHMLPQMLTQISDGLQASLTEFEVYDRPGLDPETAVSNARAALIAAASHAVELGVLLEQAQAAINSQGYTPA